MAARHRKTLVVCRACRQAERLQEVGLCTERKEAVISFHATLVLGRGMGRGCCRIRCDLDYDVTVIVALPSPSSGLYTLSE